MNYRKLEQELFNYIAEQNPDAGVAMIKAMNILEEANLNEFEMLDFASLIEHVCPEWTVIGKLSCVMNEALERIAQ